MTFESSDDAVLVARISEGDESALEAIYRKYGGAVAFVARRVLRDEALAEDVVQDVFVSFWGSPDRFDVKRGSLRSYLLTIAHRRAVDIVRSEEARSRREETTSSPDSIDLEDEVWARSQGEMVRAAVDGLGDDEKKAISLAYFSGLTYVEVAKRLDEPEGTVKSRIRTGMRKLSETLSEVAP
ncbi:MAG TPA: sigma-70 family RNA polymerase sigma factor [Acidimicrobiia bacterium]|nr:sigma-70 family RNA polymerase sigma factor [Acidimicrobiia bacterium]